MIKLKPIRENLYQEQIIYRKIKEYYDDILFGFIDKVFKEDRFENAVDLRYYILQGYLRYRDGFFTIKRNLPNKVAMELEKLGAIYSLKRRGYYLKASKIPPYILQAAAQVNIRDQERLTKISDYLRGLTETEEFITSRVDFSPEVIKIGADLDKQFKTSMTGLEIPPNMTDFQKSEIAKNYTNNLNYYIKKWVPKEIQSLRKDLEPLTLAGYRAEALEEIIQKHKGVSERKAKFLARQETKLLVAQYRKNRFKEAGVTQYIWSTILDGKERDLHRDLNGRVFSWDEPPIIDARTGEKGTPGEAYNCYSKDTEVLTKDGFKLIKDVEIGEEIATLNPYTRQFGWTYCTNKVKKRVDDIVNIKTNLLDLSVSKDHTFFYYKKTENRKIIYPVFTKGIGSLAKKNTSFYASSENWEGSEVDKIYGIPINMFCKFMGYYLSDGNVDKRSNNCIHISQCNNEEMYNELKDYLHICKGKEKLFIYNKDIFNLVEPLGYCNQKRIPEIIKSLPKEQIRVFLNAFASCDGTKKKIVKGFGKGKMNSYNQYYTTSPKMMADLVECIYKTGMSASVYTKNSKGKIIKFRNGEYKINYDTFTIQEMKTTKRNMGKAEVSINRYNDYVYDIEVAENHTILIKRGKSIHWNSNCRCIAIPVVETMRFAKG